MKKLIALFFLPLLATTAITAQPSKKATPIEGPVKHIVVNGHGTLFLSTSKDSTSRITSRNPEQLSYTYSAKNETLVIDSGAASLWIFLDRTLTIRTRGYASISVLPGDTLKADKIDIRAIEYSNIHITRPINSDTLKAHTYGHAFIAFDAIEGFDVDLADQEFSHINVDRRNILLKHSSKERKKFLGIF